MIVEENVQNIVLRYSLPLEEFKYLFHQNIRLEYNTAIHRITIIYRNKEQYLQNIQWLISYILTKIRLQATYIFYCKVVLCTEYLTCWDHEIHFVGDICDQSL